MREGEGYFKKKGKGGLKEKKGERKRGEKDTCVVFLEERLRRLFF